MMSKKKISRLRGILKSYYMGRYIPSPVVWGYYDREFCAMFNPQTMYAEGKVSCVKCEVAYQYDPSSIVGKEVLIANVTHYLGNGKFANCLEYWDAEVIEKYF